MSNPIRIAINGKFLAAPPTGVHRVAAELTDALATLASERDDLSVELVIPRDARQRAGALRLAPNVLHPLTGVPWEQLQLPFYRPDRTLLNLCNIGPIARGNAFTMIHDAQVHLTPHSYRRVFRAWYRFVQPQLARRHRGILTVSDFSRRAIAAAGIASLERIHVVPNGVDHITRVAADPTLVHARLHGARYVVALASLYAHKNIGLLFDAFRTSALSSLQLVLVGDDGAEQFAARGMPPPPNALFTGRIDDAALRGLYQHALCLAFPSRTEGFGLPPLEAMLVGCPALVAPCGALPETCGPAARYADPDRPADWADAIATMAAGAGARQQLVEHGRSWASRFTWRGAAERLVAILADSHGAAPAAGTVALQQAAA